MSPIYIKVSLFLFMIINFCAMYVCNVCEMFRITLQRQKISLSGEKVLQC